MDDSYYYFQPAWMFAKTGHFTFEGEFPTCGFQPLWAMLLAVLAFISPDKLIFLRLGLVLGAFFFCGSGFLLYHLGQKWMGQQKALIAPTLWLINPSLIDIFTNGKENALHAFLLLILISAAYPLLKHKSSPGAFIKVGIVSGLLFLSRINSALAIGIVFLFLIKFVPGHLKERLRRLTFAVFSTCLTVIPWFLPFLSYHERLWLEVNDPALPSLSLTF